MNNEHIKEYCKKFIESEKNPQFALFIKGDWGTGKTFFVNKLLKELFYECKKNKKNPYYALFIKDWGRGNICFANEFLQELNEDTNIQESDIVKISLFGVETSDDIDLKIYQAIHPLLSSRNMKIIGAFARTALKLGTNIDFNKDGTNDVSLTLGGFSFGKSKKVNAIQKKLLIVDDFERASMPPWKIFGYFSELITESDTRVIFIGNEEKISEQDEGNREYLQIKEKTIGMEFQIEPDFDEAINQFLSEFNFAEKEELRKNVAEIAEKLNCKNLRIIKQALFNLNFFMDVIDRFEEEDKEKSIIVFLMLFIQKSLNLINKDDDIIKAINVYFNTGLPYKKFLDQKKSFDYIYNNYQKGYVPLFNNWSSIIFEGNYRGDLLKESYKNEKKAIEESQKDSRKAVFKLLDFYAMDKTTFSQTVEKAQKEFKSGNYYHPGVFLHYANIMLMFANWKLIPESVDDIKEDFKQFFTDKEEQIVSEQDWEMLKTSYGGYAYNIEDPDFLQIFKKAESLNNKKILEKTKSDIKNDADLNDVSLFCSNIRHNANNCYYQHPILSYLDMDEFYKKLSEISADNQERIVESFEERYGKTAETDSNGLIEEYRADYENLKKLAEKYREDTKDYQYDPQAFRKHFVANRWAKLVEYFEKNLKNGKLFHDE